MKNYKFYYKYDVTKYTGKKFYSDFDQFYIRNGFNINHKPSITNFGKAIRKYDGVEKKRDNKGVVYYIDPELLKKYLEDKGYIENLEFVDCD